MIHLEGEGVQGEAPRGNGGIICGSIIETGAGSGSGGAGSGEEDTEEDAEVTGDGEDTERFSVGVDGSRTQERCG